MLNPLWLLFSIVVWLKKTTSLPKLYIKNGSSFLKKLFQYAGRSMVLKV